MSHPWARNFSFSTWLRSKANALVDAVCCLHRPRQPKGHHQHRSDMGCLAHDSGLSRCRTSAEVGASSEGAHAQEEATRRALMHLPAAGLEYPGDTATSVAPGVYEEMRQQTRRQDARAMEQTHEHQ
jgi:hypothetical protein